MAVLSLRAGAATVGHTDHPLLTTDDTVVTTIATDERAFEQLAQEWDELVDHSAQCVFFLRSKWNQLWWKHFAPPGSTLELIVCRDRSGRLIGLAPFYRRPLRVFGISCARELLFLGMGVPCKTSEHLDVIARHGAERAVAHAVADVMNRTRWDRLWLWQVPRRSRILPHLATALGARVRIEVCDRAPYIDTSTDWSTYKSGLGRSMRRNVEYYARRLFKKYDGCEFERVTSLDALEVGMNALADLHQARWQAKGEPGAFSPPFRAFLEEAMRDAFAASRLAFWTLKIQGRIEAALVGFIDNGILHYFQKGFNPAFANDDLGTVMLALSLRASFEDPEIRSFDFMGGGAAYKDMWARQSTENVVFELTRPTLGTLLFDARAFVGDAARSLWRGIAPTSIRALRSERLRRRRLQAAVSESASQ
jgi:hypothetical protein